MSVFGQNPPAKGKLLISEPFMSDHQFRRTVVLLVEHNAQGSVGFVLNRPINAKLTELMEGIPHIDAPIFLGGPVGQDTLHFVHRWGTEIFGTKRITEGLYWGGDFAEITQKLALGIISNKDILFFVGYAGWSEGQLEEEIKQKSWIVAPLDIELMFQNSPENLWRNVLKSLGKEFQVMSNYPEDPRMN